MEKIIRIRFACLTFCLFVFFIIETKGQYYVMDTIPQEYEIISIQKSRKDRLENCNELIERVKDYYNPNRCKKIDFPTKEARKTCKSLQKKDAKFHISKLKKTRWKLRNPQYNKNGYVLLLKNIETGQLFDVAVVKLRQMEGEKLKPYHVYKLKLYKVNERNMIRDIDTIWWVDMDGSSVSIVGKCYTRNIYVSPNLKGLKYNPQADFSDNSQTNSVKEMNH